MSKDQTFHGKEIEALLGAAARLQQKEEGGPDGLGLTLAEIEAIAAESGIDPAFVRQAALVQNSDTDDEDGFFFWGGPGAVRRKMVLKRPLSTTEMEKLVPSFRRILENEGSTDSLHNSLSWSTNERKGRAGTSVIMESEGNQTLVSLKASLLMPGFLIHYIPLILVVLIGVMGAPNLFSPTALFLKAATLALVFMVTRVAYGAFYKKKRKQLDAIQKVIEEAARADGELVGGLRGATREATVDARDTARARETARETATDAASEPRPSLEDRIELDDDDAPPDRESRPPNRGRTKN